MNEKRQKSYVPKSPEPFKLSRSAIELFVNCPKCFYINRRLGIKMPSELPFTLNSAVDALLKKEFDLYREKKEPHPLMVENRIEAIPYSHPELEKWRANRVGAQFLHKKTNFMVYGALDDIWVTPTGQLIVVDYKSTAKKDEITSLDEPWHDSYKRQMEVYQWILRQNGFDVSDTCYWVYANGDKAKEMFNATLNFRMTVVPYQGDGSWIEKTLGQIKTCLESDKVPKAARDCELCGYVEEMKRCGG